MFTPQHRLDFGSLDLVGRDNSAGGYRFSVLADGFDPGSPEAVRAIVATLWRDGDDSRITRFGNRATRFQVVIDGADLYAVGDGEKALAFEVGGPNLLTWTPPDGFGKPTVYEVLNSTMTPVPDDLDELRNRRTFAVELECRPWVRSAELTTVTFPRSASDTISEVLIVSVEGSVRTEGSIKFKATGAANIETAVVFTDPAMSEFGYSPGDPATWANAPEGRYIVWLKGPGVSGDVLTATVKSQVARTRLDRSNMNWAPIGALDLGGRRDGTLGAFTITVKQNGTTVASPTLRLFRWDDDTSLLHVENIDANEMIWDAPGVDHPEGGVWGDGVTLLDEVDSWGHPQLAAPATAIYADVHVNQGSRMDTSVEYFARWQANAAS